MTPHDAKQLSQGDTVFLLVGGYDPPHIGYCRAAEVLLSKPGVSDVWLTPLGATSEIKDMCMLVASDMSSGGRQVGCCLSATDATDKNFSSAPEAISWCRKAFPYLKFRVAHVTGDEVPDGDVVVRFASQSKSSAGGEVVLLEKLLPPPTDLKEKISRGVDESRNFQPPVWEYIQGRRLYR